MGFLWARVAEDEQRKRLRVVDDEPATEDVFRLGSETEKPRVVERLAVGSAPEPVERLASEVPEDLARRSHEPEIDAILEESDGPGDPEEGWEGKKQHLVPYGWFALIVVVLAGALIWGGWLQRPGSDGEEVREMSLERHGEAEIEQREAEALVEEVEQTMAAYLTAGRIEDMLPLVRDPERVEPLMREWYRTHPLVPRKFERLTIFQPLDLAGRLFWVVGCEVSGGSSATVNLLAEQTDEGTVRVDWESEVCYQPMPWDDFVAQRPEGRPMDFRVFLQKDRQGWYSHEFADESQWEAYRLEARGAKEYAIGYVRRGTPLAEDLDRLARVNGGRAVVAILRLSVPPGSRSHRGVVIEDLVCERWALVEPKTDSP